MPAIHGARTTRVKQQLDHEVSSIFYQHYISWQGPQPMSEVKNPSVQPLQEGHPLLPKPGHLLPRPCHGSTFSLSGTTKGSGNILHSKIPKYSCLWAKVSWCLGVSFRAKSRSDGVCCTCCVLGNEKGLLFPPYPSVTRALSGGGLAGH